MIIKNILIEGFGKHKNTSFVFDSGLNIIYGLNEAGKSTVQAFIKAMLYGLNSRSRSLSENDRLKYAPWDGGPMGGEMHFEHKGISYMLKRRFGTTRKNDATALFNDVSGEKIPLGEGREPGDWLFGATQDTFENTVFISQSEHAIDSSKDKTGEILTKLSNIAGTGNEELSVKEVEDRLNRAMLALHSPRGGKGAIDKYISEKNILSDELARYKVLKEETSDKLNHINELKASKAEIEARMQSLKNDRSRLEDARIVSDWNKINDFVNKKNTLTSELRLLEEELTYQGSQIDKLKLERLKSIFTQYTDSLKLLELHKKNFTDAGDVVNKIKASLTGGPDLGNVSAALLQDYASKINRYESLLKQYEGIAGKIDSLNREIENEIKSMLLDTPVKNSGKTFMILSITGILTGLAAFAASAAIAGAPLFLAGVIFLIIYISQQKKTAQIKAGRESKNALINTKKATIDLYKEQLASVIPENEDQVTAQNINNRLKDWQDHINSTLSATGCGSISALEEKLSAYKAQKLRLSDAEKVMEQHRVKYNESVKNSENIRNSFLSEYRIIDQDTNEKAVTLKLRSIEESLGRLDTLKRELLHTDELIVSSLENRNIDTLRIKAESITSGQNYIPAEYSEETRIQTEKEIEEAVGELGFIDQEIIKEKSSISTAFKGVRYDGELNELITNLNNDINEYEYFYKCLDTAKGVLGEAFEELQQSFGPVLNEKAAGIFAGATDNNYSDLKINKDLGIVVRSKNDLSLRDSGSLSKGALDQLYFSLRMAITDIIFDEKCCPPVFLDDTFVQYDENRTANALRFIIDESESRQIFIFTCHKKITELVGDICPGSDTRIKAI